MAAKHVAWCLALVVSVSACSIGLSPPEVTAGSQFSKTQLLRKGQTMEEIMGFLGEPFLKENKGDATRWTYYYKIEQSDIVRVLGIIPLRKNIYEWEHRLVIEFKGGKAISILEESRVLPEEGG